MIWIIEPVWVNGKGKAMEENEKKNGKFGIVIIILFVVMVLFCLCCCGGILAGILMPQYLKYLEKTKIASDHMAVNEVFTMAEVMAADPLYKDKTGAGFTVHVDQVGTISINDLSGASNPALEKELFALLGYDRITLKSTQFRSVSSSCTFVYDTDGNCTKTEAGSVTY